MVEFFGKTKSSETMDDTIRMVFRMPAFSERGARRRAGINARSKKISNFDVEKIEEVESGQLPGQKIYDVTISAPR
jgi:hypothetical protein